jgi:hypothetical protein
MGLALHYFFIDVKMAKRESGKVKTGLQLRSGQLYAIYFIWFSFLSLKKKSKIKKEYLYVSELIQY